MGPVDGIDGISLVTSLLLLWAGCRIQLRRSNNGTRGPGSLLRSGS